MKKIALVNHRYGLEVTGGSERYTRDLAEILCSHYDIEILTTCALDHFTWKNHYPKGVCDVNGIKVRRFESNALRDMHKFNKHYAKVQTISKTDANLEKMESEFVDRQGPYCPELVEYIRKNIDEYDVFVFVTYLYYPTVRAIKYVKDKSMLISTAHDEPPIYFDTYKNIFSYPKAIGFLTDEEREFVHSLFSNEQIPHDVIGYHVVLPSSIAPSLFKSKYNLDNYIVYVGRVEAGKYCNELCDYFIRYKNEHSSNLKLVFIGQVLAEVPTHPDIISLGFISEEDKFNGIAGARMLVMPSQYESLSIVTLEALALGVPVVVNGRSEILRGHCTKSNAGLYYTNYYEFAGAINYMLSHDDVYAIMQTNGKKYIEYNYTAEVLIKKFDKLINVIMHDELI